MTRVAIVGGGAAGLAAAYALKKRGLDPMLIEAADQVGGRLRGDEVDGFRLDAGADFFCSSYDVAFRLCEELGLNVLRSRMQLGFHAKGRWTHTMPVDSLCSAIRSLPWLWKLGFLSPRGAIPAARLAAEIKRRSQFLNFSSDSRLAELDGNENAVSFLARRGVPDEMTVLFRGLLEMTMGELEQMSAPYALAYLSEMLIKAGALYVPEEGAASLAYALRDACGDSIRTSTSVREVIFRDGAATGVATDDGPVWADAVICAVPGTRVTGIIPDLPNGIRQALDKVVYSTGCRVVIGLGRPPLPPGWHGAVYPEDETPLLLDRSINLPACAPHGKSTLDMMVGRGRAEALLSLEDEEIKRAMLKDVRLRPPPGSALPADDAGIFTRVYRWKEAVCMGPPGMFSAVADMRREFERGGMKNLFLAGDYMRVPSVNGALASGIDAANDAADRLASHQG